MTDIPKIVPVNLGKSLIAASEAHQKLGEIIAGHAETAAENRRTAHERLAAENRLNEVTGS